MDGVSDAVATTTLLLLLVMDTPMQEDVLEWVIGSVELTGRSTHLNRSKTYSNCTLGTRTLSISTRERTITASVTSEWREVITTKDPQTSKRMKIVNLLSYFSLRLALATLVLAALVALVVLSAFVLGVRQRLFASDSSRYWCAVTLDVRQRLLLD